jgi:hypothetical protein
MSTFRMFIKAVIRALLNELIPVNLVSPPPYVSFSLNGERISQQSIAQLIGDPRYLQLKSLSEKTRKSNPLLMLTCKGSSFPYFKTLSTWVLTKNWTWVFQLGRQGWWPRYHVCWLDYLNLLKLNYPKIIQKWRNCNLSYSCQLALNLTG